MKKSSLAVAALLTVLAAPVVSVAYAEEATTPAASSCKGCAGNTGCKGCKGCSGNEGCKGCKGCSGNAGCKGCGGCSGE